MKKQTMILTVIIGFIALTLTGCGDFNTDSSYWEDWFDTVGYVEVSNEINERTGEIDSNSKFIAGKHPEDVAIAVRHEHKYTNSLSCTFKVKKLTTDLKNDIIDELKEDSSLTKRFSIPKNTSFEKIEGFIFYCDDEYVYVVNNLYKDGYVEHTSTRSNPELRFEISINGLPKLTIDMDYKPKVDNKPY